MTYALRQRGDKYRFGAEGPDRWDCSGLVWFSYRKAGFRHLPRTSRQQYRAVRHIRPMRLQRGDLMFFHTKKGRVYHVAIFLGWRHGHRLMLHAPNTGQARAAGAPLDAPLLGRDAPAQQEAPPLGHPGPVQPRSRTATRPASRSPADDRRLGRHWRHAEASTLAQPASRWPRSPR